MLHRIVFSLCILTFVIQSHSQALVTNEWMKALSDSLPLNRISIPGTHDSGALEGGEAFQTQDITISEQLEAGVRCFDIRLKACDDGGLGVYHSIVFQDAYWEADLLPTFITFLKAHPTEALIVMVKKEGGDSNAFSNLLSKSLCDAQHKELFIPLFTKDLTLGECRGRILLLHRDQLLADYPGAQCHGWKDNATFSATLKGTNGAEAPMSVEDEYQFASSESASYKVETTWKHLQLAGTSATTSRTWHISYASATALPEEGPISFATPVNAQLAHLTSTLSHPCGILLIDFAGSDAGRRVIKNLIRANLP